MKSSGIDVNFYVAQFALVGGPSIGMFGKWTMPKRFGSSLNRALRDVTL